jgi:hypothetical protein
VPPKREEYFGSESSSPLPYGKRHFEPQSTYSLSSQECGPNPSSQPNKGSYDPLSQSSLSSDSEYFTTKPQIAAPHDKDISPFRGRSVEASADTSLLQVSIVPSLSFEIQDTAQLGALSVVLEDPLALARNITHGYGAVEDSKSVASSPHEFTGESYSLIFVMKRAKICTSMEYTPFRNMFLAVLETLLTLKSICRRHI